MNEFKPQEDLRALYRTAFEDWALQAGRLEQIRDSAPEVPALGDAQFRTGQAETGYREIRNRLVDEMAAGRNSAENDRNLKMRTRIKGMKDHSLKEFFETCENFCAAAIRRGGQPSVFFAFRKRLAEEEMTRRMTAQEA